jgi:hypothetical protein
MASLPPVPFLSELAKTMRLPYGHKKRREKKEKGD